MPRNLSYFGPIETFYVFDEAKSSFVYGCFVATTVLSAAVVEHWLTDRVSERGHAKEAERGFAAMIQCCREHNLLNAALVDRIDRLRLIRNPFMHVKGVNHPHTLSRRLGKQRTHPERVLEQDAKDSLITMYTVVALARL
jgi:hypothetical protein